MLETSTAGPQMFSNAGHFDITNSIFVTSNAPPTIASPAVSRSPLNTPRDLSSESGSIPILDNSGSVSLVDSEVYARLLLPLKKGYPLWKPKPDEHLPEEYRRVGVSIE
ncbi:hypothetical protein BDP27DRAFT_663833 [Rhodocollybia butyracea]|uniref:Uncharacterized protein n=1 Tax=Rhodocollybia butyracea TaxID=206335 RepID=A0A9P5PXK1_9AGAR|nr:hypothetical protein BDP27DRAFT_663833 [Rhodocollybia butyracea]